MPDKKAEIYVKPFTFNVIWANQMTESFEYHWLRALAMLDVCAFPPFCRASDVISNSVNLLNTHNTNLAGQTDKSKYMYQAQTGGAQQACRGRI